ncbi:hypothetical protein V2W30_08915 [Streptomyces sp. Q6]|uniref:Uncharacterized protein n=1 Tax=Streptomyces citrinus TaxID=3118173 RepID=A0ACD5AC48_9ACTN
MYLPRRVTPARTVPALAALALLLLVPFEALSDTGAKAAARPVEKRELFGADCRIRVEGPLVSATCHNPYPRTDRVALHIECDAWWDIDVDAKPVPAGPAETVRLDGRCWKKVRTAWVSHRKAAV